jgi:hypothetical protein
VTEPLTITVRPQDIAEGRAFIRIGPEARIKLAHMAGAPWSDKDPDAKLHDLQKECLRRPEREKIIHGASRLGKSVLGGCEGLVEAMTPGGKLAVVAGSFNHVAHEWQYIDLGLKNLFKGIGQAFTRLRFVHRPAQHDYDFLTIWGSKGRGFSVHADEGASLLGQEFTRMILGEGSHVTQDILEKKAMRALDGALMKKEGEEHSGREAGYLSIYTTPKEHAGCSSAEWDRIEKQTKREPRRLWYTVVPFPQTCWLREADILENPAYDRSVYEARRKSMRKAAFDEQYRGKRTFATGRVLQEFNDDLHVFEGQPPHELVRNMTLGVGIDTGAYFGAVLGGLVEVDGRPKRFKLGEVYLEQVDIYTALGEVEEMIVDKLGPVFHVEDFEQLSTTIDVWAIDPASQHKPEINAHWDHTEISLMSPPGIEGGKLELIPSLDVMRQWIADGDWLVSDDCQILLQQIRRYVWKQTKAAGMKSAPVIKEPRKADDHLIDAARFLDFSLAVEGLREEPPPVFTMKEAWDRHQRDRVWGPLKAVLRAAKEMEEDRYV